MALLVNHLKHLENFHRQRRSGLRLGLHQKRHCRNRLDRQRTLDQGPHRGRIPAGSPRLGQPRLHKHLKHLHFHQPHSLARRPQARTPQSTSAGELALDKALLVQEKRPLRPEPLPKGRVLGHHLSKQIRQVRRRCYPLNDSPPHLGPDRPGSPALPQLLLQCNCARWHDNWPRNSGKVVPLRRANPSTNAASNRPQCLSSQEEQGSDNWPSPHRNFAQRHNRFRRVWAWLLGTYRHWPNRRPPPCRRRQACHRRQPCHRPPWCHCPQPCRRARSHRHRSRGPCCHCCYCPSRRRRQRQPYPPKHLYLQMNQHPPPSRHQGLRCPQQPPRPRPVASPCRHRLSPRPRRGSSTLRSIAPR